MLKRELKVNLKGFLIWTGVLLAMYLVVFAIYPSIMSSVDIDQLNDLLLYFPEELLKAFNMDISGIDTPFGWLKSEGYTFLLLAISCYGAILGSSIVLKEESDKTIEYLVSLPISSKQIYISKAIAGLVYTVGMVVVIGIFNYIGLKLTGSFDEGQYFLLAICPLFAGIVFFTGGLLISTFFHKSKMMLGISLGWVFISYMLQIISGLGEKVEFVKYFTVFTLSESRSIIQGSQIEGSYIMISIILAGIFLIAGCIRYMKKDLLD